MADGAGSRRLIFIHYDQPSGSAFYNMALDECILEAAASERAEIWRLYQWNPAAVSIGRNQKVADAVNLDVVGKLGLHLVRRPTGGRAIWHSGDVCFTNSAPITPDRNSVSSFKEDYLKVSALLVEFLRILGISAGISPGSPSLRSAKGPIKSPCFQTSGRFEITVSGRKIAGVSQFVAAGSYLMQGSVRTQRIDAMNRRLFFQDGSEGDMAFDRLAAQVTSIEEETGGPVSWRVLDSALASALKSQLIGDADRQPARLIVDLDRVARIERDKYGSDVWNLRF